VVQRKQAGTKENEKIKNKIYRPLKFLVLVFLYSISRNGLGSAGSGCAVSRVVCQLFRAMDESNNCVYYNYEETNKSIDVLVIPLPTTKRSFRLINDF
jgi:hypothetical protein